MARKQPKRVISQSRMANAFIDIIDLCKTDPCTWKKNVSHEDWAKLVRRIGEAAHYGLYGDNQ